MEIPSKFKAIEKVNTQGELASYIFSMRTQFHIFHLQTKKYSSHKTLNKLYDKILDKGDKLIETIQGKTNTVIRGYVCYPYLENDDFIGYTKNCIKYFNDYRAKCIVPGWDNIDSQVQTIIDDLEQSLYLFTLQ